MKELEELERLARQYKVQPYAQDAFVLAASPDFVLSLIRELNITHLALRRRTDSPNVLKNWLDAARHELYPETEQPK